jgi:hypothetical protein
MKKNKVQKIGKINAKIANKFDKILPKNIPNKNPNTAFIKDFLLNKRNNLGLFLSKLEYILIFCIFYPL